MEQIENKRLLPAELCSCIDDEKSSMHLEFSIPGVHKDEIDLKVTDDSFSLSAEKDDIEYVSTGTFCCQVDADKSDANYENGLLLVNIPLKDPWKDSHKVTIH